MHAVVVFGTPGLVIRHWDRCSKKHARFAVGLCLLFWSRLSQAYRPFDSTDASVAAPGEFELELGPVGYLESASQDFVVAPAAVLNLGVLANWEVVLQGRQFILADAPAGEPRLRLVDTGVFLKGVLSRGSLQDGSFQDEGGPSVAVELGPLLPTVNGDPGVGATGIGIVSERGTSASLHVNGAVSYTRAHNLDLFGGVIVEGANCWRVRPVAEVFVEREFDTAFVLSGLLGAIWRFSDALSFDAAMRAALVNEDRLLEGRIGLTWATCLW